MKVLLANLPWFENGYTGVRAGSRWPHIKNATEKDYLPFPFHMAYSAALLKENNFNVTLLDCIAEEMNVEEFLKFVKKSSPDIIVSEISAPSRKNDLGILKKLPSNIKIVICGPDIEITGKEVSFKIYPFIDATINGEYEQALLLLIKAYHAKFDISSIGGIAYRDGDRICKSPDKAVLSDVNNMPWPYRNKMPMKKYIDAPGGLPLPNAQMWASRGCPFKCSFCAWPQIMGKANLYRPRNIDDILNEMHYLVHKLKFKSIYFDDDTFNVGHDRMKEFCRKLIERRKKGEILVPWAIMARADLMTEDLIDLFKEAGLYAVKYGVESANQNILDMADKNMSLIKSIKMIRYTQKCSIKIHLTFIFGLPGETKETMQNTTDLALSLNPDSLQFSLATPFPGTKLYDILNEQSKLTNFKPEDLDGNHTSVITSSGLKPEDLIQAKDNAYQKWNEFCHLRRNPQQIKIHSWHIKRAKSFLKHYGFKPLAFKIIDYLKFYRQHNKEIKNHRYKTIAMSDIRITLVSSTLRLFHKERELSRGPGFQSSFRMDGIRYDTSLCDTRVNRSRENEFYIEFDFKSQNLSLKQIWWVNISKPDKISWRVDWFSKKNIKVYEIKFSLMTIDDYHFYFNDREEYKFPKIEDWQTLDFEANNNFIGLKSYNVPELKFSFNHSFKKHVQNTSRFESARMIHAYKRENVQIKAGRWPAFAGSLKVS